MNRKHKMTAGLLAAVILVVALGAVGFAAARSGVLDYLFEAKQPPELALENLVEPGQSVTEDGLTLTFDGYINDGAELSLVWTISSSLDEMVLVGTGYPKLSEQLESHRMSSLIGYEELAALGGEFDGQTFEKAVQVSIPYDIPADLEGQEIDVTLTAKAYRSKVGYAPRGNEGGDTPAMFSADGKLLLSHGRTLAMTEVPEEALEALASVSLSTTIKPPKSALHTVPVGQTEFEFEDYTLAVKKLDFGATRGLCELLITTKAAHKNPLADDSSGDWWSDSLTGRNYRLVTDAGEDLWCQGMGTDWEQLPDGRLQYVLKLETDPPIAVPTSVRIVPMFLAPGTESEEIDGKSVDDYYVLLKAHSIDAESVTVTVEQGELPASRQTKPVGETHYEFADRTFDLLKLNFADDRTVAVFTLTTDEQVPEKDLMYETHPLVNQFYAQVDGDGNGIPGIREIRGMKQYEREARSEGGWVIRYQVTWPAAEVVPERATLAPIAYPFDNDAYGNLDQYTVEQMNEIYRAHFIQDELVTVGVEVA